MTFCKLNRKFFNKYGESRLYIKGPHNTSSFRAEFDRYVKQINAKSKTNSE